MLGHTKAPDEQVATFFNFLAASNIDRQAGYRRRLYPAERERLDLASIPHAGTSSDVPRLAAAGVHAGSEHTHSDWKQSPPAAPGCPRRRPDSWPSGSRPARRQPGPAPKTSPAYRSAPK